MADNKPALFPITAFIVSYHYARSDGLCVTRVTAYDLFIATPPSPPYTRPKCALHQRLHQPPATRNPSAPPVTPSRLLLPPATIIAPAIHRPFHLPAVINTRQIFYFLHRGNGVVRMDRM